MKEVNRTIIIVKPAEPFIKWINSFEEEKEELPKDFIGKYNTAYIVSGQYEEDDLPVLLKKYYPAMFARELYKWYEDESYWPKKRDYSTFLKWFRIERYTMVYKL